MSASDLKYRAAVNHALYAQNELLDCAVKYSPKVDRYYIDLRDNDTRVYFEAFQHFEQIDGNDVHSIILDHYHMSDFIALTVTLETIENESPESYAERFADECAQLAVDSIEQRLSAVLTITKTQFDNDALFLR